MKRVSVAGVALLVVLALVDARGQESPPVAHDDQAKEHSQAGGGSTDTDANDAVGGTAEHVPPPSPRQPMTAMSGKAMTDAMEMNDAASIAMLRFDRLERTDGDGAASTAWKLSASVGGDFDKFLVRSEGGRTRGELDRSDVEALWSHAIASYWDAQVGVRHDFGPGADRTWAAFGVQGVAPSWVEVGATVYVGDAGRTAFRFEADYDLTLTQRLILQPRLEINWEDGAYRAAPVSRDSSDAEVGLRLRYEVRRTLAPYIGIERSWRFGGSSDPAGIDVRGTENRWVAGLKVWY